MSTISERVWLINDRAEGSFCFLIVQDYSGWEPMQRRQFVKAIGKVHNRTTLQDGLQILKVDGAKAEAFFAAHFDVLPTLHQFVLKLKANLERLQEQMEAGAIELDLAETKAKRQRDLLVQIRDSVTLFREILKMGAAVEIAP